MTESLHQRWRRFVAEHYRGKTTFPWWLNRFVPLPERYWMDPEPEPMPGYTTLLVSMPPRKPWEWRFETTRFIGGLLIGLLLGALL